MRSKSKYSRRPLSLGRQKGIAFIVMFFILALAIIAAITAYSVRSELTQTTISNLREAKEALIARAINDANRPGSLPCPDTNDDGVAELFVSGQCPSYIGLLPWKTLSLPDVRDTNGQRFWYVLSPNFRDDDTAYPINSQTAPQITLDNQTEKLMALVIAPGPPLTGQSRSGSLTIPGSTSDYLDGLNGDNDINMVFSTQPTSSNFNDQLISIQRDDIFPQIERLALVEVRNNLQTYYNSHWQRFPFAAAWADTSISPIGVSDLLGGRLPMGTTASNITFGPITATMVPTPSISTCYVDNCTFIRFGSGASTVTITFKIHNVGTGFFDLLDSSDIYKSGGNSTYTSQTINQVMDAAGDVTYTATGKVNFINPIISTITVGINKPTKSAYWDKTVSPSWVWRNRWDSFIYYRVGTSDMTNDCATPNLCLTINGAPNSSADNPAILLMAGRALDATAVKTSPAQAARPSDLLNEYFDTVSNTDNSNLTTTAIAADLSTNRIFDSIFKPTLMANDQVIGIKP